LGLEALLGKRRAGAGRVLALRGAAQLTGCLADRSCDVELETGDARVRLPTLHTRADRAHLLEAAAKRIADRDTQAPHRIVLFEPLSEHIAEPGIDAAGHDTGESAGAQQLRSAEPGAAVRGLDANVWQLLVRIELDVGRRIFHVVARATEIV